MLIFAMWGQHITGRFKCQLVVRQSPAWVQFVQPAQTSKDDVRTWPITRGYLQMKSGPNLTHQSITHNPTTNTLSSLTANALRSSLHCITFYSFLYLMWYCCFVIVGKRQHRWTCRFIFIRTCSNIEPLGYLLNLGALFDSEIAVHKQNIIHRPWF